MRGAEVALMTCAPLVADTIDGSSLIKSDEVAPAGVAFVAADAEEIASGVVDKISAVRAPIARLRSPRRGAMDAGCPLTTERETRTFNVSLPTSVGYPTGREQPNCRIGHSDTTA
jgi:hypothetical protein